MQRPDGAGRHLLYAGLALLAAVILAAAALIAIVRASSPQPPVGSGVAAQAPALPSPTVVPSPPTRAMPTGTPSPATFKSNPQAQISALTAGLPSGSVSVAARNLNTGATFQFGSAGGQTMASIVKLDILETLMLQRQTDGDGLSDDEDSEATSMIEHSDDDAADQLWADVGGGSAVSRANQRLGVPCTTPASDDYWGLSTTCARGQIQLLYQLENSASPLDQSSRGYILNLMQNVESDQTWGVPVAADPNTVFAVKNGWLNLQGDTDWAINSDGIVIYHGQTLLLSVLTQNNDTDYSGTSLVQELAPLAAQSVAS